MVNLVHKILSMSPDQIIGSDDCLLLIKCYSNLYLGGGQCRICANSQRRYYNSIKKNGLEMAKKFEESNKRTCVPNWNGNKWITNTGKFWSSVSLTDADAIMLLEKGFIQESKFITLPEGYKNEPSIIKATLYYNGIEKDVLELTLEDDSMVEYSDIDKMEQVIDELTIELVVKNYDENQTVDSYLGLDGDESNRIVKLEEEFDVINGIEADIKIEEHLGLEYSDEENDCIEEIKCLLDEGMSVSKIKSKYKSVKTIGNKKCTQKELSKLIKIAKSK